MVWTKKDYPESLKNLEENTRLKAIDILNAMIEEGYDEDTAIPIATSQAKDWINDASNKEIEKLMKKNITKHKDNNDASSSRLQNANVEVFYSNKKEQWAVKSIGANRVSSYHETKKEAIKKAEHIAANRDTNILKHNKNEKRNTNE